jgi:tetratricopeptide (TPR) repeat protein
MTRGTLSIALLALILSSAPARPAAAQPLDPSAPYRDALRAEREGDPERALAAYHEVIAHGGGKRLARRAKDRAAWLEARALSEGDTWAALRAYLRFTNEPNRSAELIAAYEAELDSLPHGLSRREGRHAVAEAWFSAGEHERAERAFRALLVEPRLAERERRLAVTGVTRAIAARGHHREAIEWLEASQVDDPELAEGLGSELRAKVGIPWALAVLATFTLAASLVTRGRWLAPRVLAAAARPGVWPLALYLLIGPGLIAATYDHEALDTFVTLMLFTLPVLFITRSAALALPRHATTAARATLLFSSVLAHVAAGYLVLAVHGHALSFRP